MQAPFEEDRTWQSTMALLSGEADTQQPPAVSSRVRPTRGAGNFSKCAIRILERNGQTSATIAWSDATSCCYGEQLWRRCIARKTGVCALSGQAIARGDAVYRPRRVRPAPRNVEAMILATVMEATPVKEI
ncbi:DUF3331 domain-containing protein [Paraburkholderia sp. FT54]|uniref:DUF3331 domain-containing protein n=1 Tax=Paraburkholderia sp. FT54 TaxID=3074437 RepID=UPI002877CC12|nr:DUF3331 domain-containing protein [Paraburkholderia sp. FT54]WNC89163.1 DUF3331 domain-containing protein [Paraburkholderia sp. FT54]